MHTLIIFGATYLILLSLIIAVIFFIQSNRETKRQIVIFVLCTAPLAFLLSLLARHLYNSPRPFVVDGSTPLIPHAADNGFPSDHMLLASLIAAVVGCFNKKVSFWLWIVAFVVGISRMLAGVHHAVDISASVVISVLAVYIVSIVRYAILIRIKTNSDI